MLSWLSSDASAVAAVVSGDHKRFEVLVRRHFKDVQAVAFAYTRNQADAEDIAQEAFLRAFSSLAQLREPGKFRHWLLTITRNHAHQLWQQRQREGVPPESVPAATEPGLALQVEERRQLVAKHLAAMEPAQREVLMLHYFAGRSTREIAGLLEIEREAVKKRLERARAALGASLLQELDEIPARSDRRRQTRKIMAAALALPLARNAAATSPLLAGAALMPKAAMVLLAALLGVALLVSIDRVGTSAISIPKSAAEPTGQSFQFTEQDRVATSESAQEPSPPVPATENTPPLVPVSSPAPSMDCGDMEKLESFASNEAPAAGDNFKEKSLESHVNIEFEEIGLADILGFVKMQWDIPLYLDETIPALQHKVVTDGMIATLNLPDVQASEALIAICEPLGLAYAIEPGYVWISSTNYIQRETQRRPESDFEGYDCAAALEKSVSLEFENVHLSEVMDFVSESLKLNVVLDWRVISPKVRMEQAPGGISGLGSPLPPGAFPGGAGAFPGKAAGLENSKRSMPVVNPPMLFEVPHLSLKNIKIRHALSALLRPLDLSYQVKPFGVVISSPSQLNSFTPRPVVARASATITRALLAPVNLVSEHPSVLACLRSLQEQTGLCVRVNPAAQESLARSFSACEYKWISLGTALYFLSLQADQPFLISGDTLYVGAKSADEIEGEFAPIQELS